MPVAPRTFLAVIDKYENEKFEDEEEEAPAAEPAKQRKVLAVTAARQVLHIPIWQQRLCRRWPGKMGVAMKVETNGQRRRKK